jgi:monovalent cation/proton antiporter MnhG/PhaG subunit
VSPTDAVSTGLMALGAGVLVLGSIGSAWPRNAYVRLHYLSMSGVLGAPVVLLGAVVRDPGDWFKLLVISVLLAGTSPVAAVATARAVTRRGGESGSAS